MQPSRSAWSVISAVAEPTWHAPTGATTIAAVIGHPVAHSLSPVIHNAAFVAAGVDWTYAAFDVDAGEGGAAVEAMRTLGLGGLSVTMPHKDTVAGAVDRLSAAAEALGAVNCVSRDGDVLVGHNTDGAGLVDALQADDVDLAGARIAVLGAGGAARAVCQAFGVAGATEIVVLNRTPARAAEAVSLAGSCGRTGTTADLAGVEIIVNATSVGMAGTSGDGALPVPASTISASHVVVDLVYNPMQTPLLEAASDVGARAIGGVGMLIHQAAHQFRLWTGVEPPLAAMEAAVADALAAQT